MGALVSGFQVQLPAPVVERVGVVIRQAFAAEIVKGALDDSRNGGNPGAMDRIELVSEQSTPSPEASTTHASPSTPTLLRLGDVERVDRERGGFTEWQPLLRTIRALPEVSAATPLVQGEVMITSQTNLSGVILRFNLQGGVVTSRREQGVPLFERFFLGGIFDVRGYRLRTISPRLALNNALDPNAAVATNGAAIAPPGAPPGAAQSAAPAAQ